MKRIWIVGNGPSLRYTPLNKLIGETTFAMNRIHRIYDKTDWRPSLYYLVDYAVQAGDIWRTFINVHKELNIPMWLLDVFRSGFPENHPNHKDLPEGIGDIPNVTWVPRCERHHYYNAPNSHGMQEWHLPTICTAYSGISGMIQVASTLGYDEICLVGCDLGYTVDRSVNHFVPDYNTTDTKDPLLHQANSLKAHEVAARCCPIPVYNCSVGGYLEVHPRRNIYDVLEGKYDT